MGKSKTSTERSRERRETIYANAKKHDELKKRERERKNFENAADALEIYKLIKNMN